MEISVSVEQIIVGVSVVLIIGGFTPLGNNIRVEQQKLSLQQDTNKQLGFCW